MRTVRPISTISTSVVACTDPPKCFYSILWLPPHSHISCQTTMNLRQPLLKLGSHIRSYRRFSDQISLPSAPLADTSTHSGEHTIHIAASSFQNPREQLEDMNRPIGAPAPSPVQPPESLPSPPNDSSSLNLPSPVIQRTGPPPIHVNPFHTHVFFTALEKTFPSPVARTLMAATRGLLVDRILKIRRESLITKDLDNVGQGYSFFRPSLNRIPCSKHTCSGPLSRS